MNELHRTVLQKHTQDIVRDVIVTETLLGNMFQKNIFDSEMIEIIKAGRTHSEQVYKMLELLPKRGPDAFDSFYEILQEEYSWVAKLLRESLETESERILAAQAKREEEIMSETMMTPRASSANGPMDADIKIRVSAFVQKHFAQIRRISNTDKKAIEYMMSKWLQSERKRISKSIDQAYLDAHQGDVLESRQVKDRVFTLYTQLAARQKRSIVKRLLNKNARTHPPSAMSNGTEQLENEEQEMTAENISFDHLKAEMDKMFAHMDYMEKQIERSYDFIGARHSGKEISILVHELCGEYRYKESELHKEKSKTEKMLVELYEFSTNKSKLESVIHTHEHEILALKEQLNKYKAEITELIKEVTVLEKEKQVHLEKERTLADLKKTKEDLHLMIQVVNKENKDLRDKLQGQLKQGMKPYLNRKPQTNAANNGNKLSPRRTLPKKRSLSFRN